MSSLTFLTLRQRPELLETAASWFHSKWGVPREAHRRCIDDYVNRRTEYGWYLCMEEAAIAGGLGVIENDFHHRKDLASNLCAVYTEAHCRCQGIAGRLLSLAVEDLRRRGISPVYLLTDHTGFYERYGWALFPFAQGALDETPSRLYIHRSPQRQKSLGEVHKTAEPILRKVLIFQKTIDKIVGIMHK